jgi:hypothetical protein
MFGKQLSPYLDRAIEAYCHSNLFVAQTLLARRVTMREYILTRKERDVVKQYFSDGVSNDYIHLIRHRAKANSEKLKEDLELLNRLITS